MKTVCHQDLRIATEAFGSADDPALVLVMGATAAMLGWPDELCHSLANRGLCVIRFDHRDTGRSTTVPPGEATYSVEDMAADVMAVLDGYGLERSHLMGMSLGGYISQMLAILHPDRILSLTLIASEPLGWDGPALPHISQAFFDHFAGLKDLDWSDEGEVANFLLETERLSVGSGRHFDEARQRARIGKILARTDSPASMFNHATLTTRDDWTGQFRRIACPVLVIHGNDDPILPVGNGQAIASGILGAEMLTLPGTGHELPLSMVDVVADRVAAHVLRMAP